MYRMNNKKWNMSLVEPYSHILQRSDGSYALGVCDNATQDIYIANNLPPQKLRKVLIHEVTHSAMFSYGIELSVEQEELFCDLIASYGDEIFRVVDEIFRILKF